MGNVCGGSSSQPVADNMGEKPAAKQMTLYYNPLSPPSRSVLFALKHLKVPNHVVKTLDLLKGEHKQEAYLKVNPNGTVPCLSHGELNIFESRAIMLYLFYNFAPEKFRNKSPEEAAKIRQTYYWDQELVFPGFIQILPGTLFGGSKPTQKQVDIARKSLQMVEDRLKSRGCLAVDYVTLVDIMVAQFILQLTTIPGVVCMKNYPCMEKWFAKIEGMADYKESIKAFLPMQKKLSMQLSEEGRDWVEPTTTETVETTRSKSPEEVAPAAPIVEKKVVKVASPEEAVYWSRLSPPSTVAAIVAKIANPNAKLVELNMMKQEHKEDWYKGINPNGSVPGYKHEDLNIFESGAITRYLAAKGNRFDLISEDLETKANIYKMMCHINENLFPVISKLIFPCIVNKVEELVTAEKVEAAKASFAKFEGILEGKTFIWGDKITIPDIHCASLFGYINLFEEKGMDIKAADYPNVCAWLKRVAADDDYKKASGAVINCFDPKIIMPPGSPVNVSVVRSHC